MEIEKILEQFARFAGVTLEEAQEWQPLCEGACLSLPVKPEADLEDPRLILAAAGEAYRQYLLLRQGNLSTAKVGDISITQQQEGGTAVQAAALRDALWAAASPLLENGGCCAGIWQVGL